MTPREVLPVPDAEMVRDDSGEPAPGLGIGFVVLLVVIGLGLLALAWGGVVVVLQLVQSLSGLP